MPLLRSEVIHGWPCKFYDNCCVTVGTRTADRFTIKHAIKVPADEVSWFATRLRAELIESELALAGGAASGQRAKLAKWQWQPSWQPRRVKQPRRQLPRRLQMEMPSRQRLRLRLR